MGFVGPRSALDPDLFGSRRAATRVWVDEAQDTNPVFADLLKRMMKNEDLQIVLVGDPNQSIYGFRGAINELDTFDADIDLQLNTSRRYGKQNAEYSNILLRARGGGQEAVGKGPDNNTPIIPGVLPDFSREIDVILTRNNITIWDLLKRYDEHNASRPGDPIRTGISYKYLGEVLTIIQSLKAVQFGDEKRTGLDPEFSKFRNLEELFGELGTGGNPNVKKWLKIIQKIGNPTNNKEQEYGVTVRNFIEFVQDVTLTGERGQAQKRKS